MFTTILVPLDGSLLAARALPLAARLARAGQSRLLLVRAHLPNSDNLSLRLHYPEQTATERANLDRGLALAELVAATDRLRRAGLKVEPRFVEAAAADAILETVASSRPDLIVMSTHGHSGLGRWLHGSVADEVLRRADRPVLLISPSAMHSWREGQPRRVVVSFDGSGISKTVFEPAVELASALNAELFLVSVVEPPIIINAYGDTIIPPDPEQELAEAQRDVEEAAEELRLKTAQPVSVRVAYGDAAASINQIASEIHATAVAMATHGRSGLARVVMGSVATRTLQQARVPVLLYRGSAIRDHAAGPLRVRVPEHTLPQVH